MYPYPKKFKAIRGWPCKGKKNRSVSCQSHSWCVTQQTTRLIWTNLNNNIWCTDYRTGILHLVRDSTVSLSSVNRLVDLFSLFWWFKKWHLLSSSLQRGKCFCEYIISVNYHVPFKFTKTLTLELGLGRLMPYPAMLVSRFSIQPPALSQAAIPHLWQRKRRPTKQLRTEDTALEGCYGKIRNGH